MAIIGQAHVEVLPSIASFNDKVKAKLGPEAKKLGKQLGDTIGDEIRDGMSKGAAQGLADAKAIAKDGVDIKAKLDQKEFDAQEKVLAAKVDKASAKTINIRAKIDSSSVKAINFLDKADRKIGGLVKSAGGLSKVFAIGTGATSGIAALISATEGIGAVAVPGLIALTGALGGAAAGLGVFAGVLASNKGDLKKAFEPLKDAWKTFADEKGPAGIKTAARAMQILAPSVKLLGPFFDGANKAFNGLLDGFKEFTKSGGLARDIQQWAQFTGPAIQSIGKFIGNALDGLSGVVDAFAPSLKGLLGGLDDIGDSFANWGQNLKNSKGLTDFMGYVHDVGPQVGRTLKDLGKGIGGLFVGLAPSTIPSLKLISGLVETLGKGLGNTAAKLPSGLTQLTDLITSPEMVNALDSIGNLASGILSNLAPAVKPALDLISTIADGLGPIVDDIGEQLPGVITSIDGFVKKAAPFAQAFAKGFTKTTADAIKTVAKYGGELFDGIDSLTAGNADNVAKIVGSMVALGALAKITRLSKLPGIIAGVFSAAKGKFGGKKGDGGFGDFGNAAGNAAGKLDDFSGAKGREKEALKGNAEKLGANAKGFEKVAEKSVAASGGLGKFITSLSPGKMAAAIGLVGGLATKVKDVPLHNVIQFGAKQTVSGVVNNIKNNLIPKVAKQWNVIFNGNASPFGKVYNRVAGAINSLVTKPATISILGNASGALGAIDSVWNALRGIDGQTATTTVVTNHVNNTTNNVQNNVKTTHKADGGPVGENSSNSSSIFMHGSADGTASGSGGDSFLSKFKHNLTHPFGSSSHIPGASIPLPGWINVIPKSLPVVPEVVPVFAGGGNVNGRGTGTSDSIPAMLSNGEFVVRASSAAVYGPLLHAINNSKGGPLKRAEGGGVGHFATGGRVNLDNLLTDLIASINRGIRGQSNGSRIQDSSSYQAGRVQDSVATAGTQSRLLSVIRRDNGELQKLANARTKIGEQISTANDYASGIKSAARDFASPTGFANVTNSKTFLSVIKNRLSTLKGFNANLKKADRRGVNRDLLDQIAQAGPDAAQYAKILADAPGYDIYRINKAERGIQGISSALSGTATSLNNGISTSKSFVQGLQKQQGAIDKLMDKWAGRFASGIRNTIATGKAVQPKKAVKRATGGWVLGPGSSTSDSVPLDASNGEFVVNARAASRNASLLQRINSGSGATAQAGRSGVQIDNVNLYNDTEIQTFTRSLAFGLR